MVTASHADACRNQPTAASCSTQKSVRYRASALPIRHLAARRKSAQMAGELSERGQTLPVEAGARIAFAPGRNIAMPGNGTDRVITAQHFEKSGKTRVLSIFEGQLVAPFQLDAQRKIIAARLPFPAGNTRMPGALLTGDELNQLTIAPDEKMRGDTQVADPGKIGMRCGVQRIGEQADDIVAAELGRRQTDRMNNDQRRRFAGWPIVEIRRIDTPGDIEPAGVDPCVHVTHSTHSSMPSRSIR